MNKLLLRSVCNEDKDITDDDMIVKLDCFEKGCSRKNFYARVIFKSRVVTCPECGTKYKVRCFKNQKINMTRVFK